MNNLMNNTILGAGFTALALSFGVGAVSAQTCVVPPSCETLGFTQTAANCSGKRTLKCPLDQTKVYCECGDGYTVDTTGNCKANDCSGYPATSCNTTAGSCGSYCKSGEVTKYKYTSCNSGWTLSSGNCVANSCDGYYASTRYCSSYDTCKSGSYTMYKCTACSACHILTGGRCDNMVYATTVDSKATSYDTCTEGGVTKYKATACQSNYRLDTCYKYDKEITIYECVRSYEACEI